MRDDNYIYSRTHTIETTSIIFFLKFVIAIFWYPIFNTSLTCGRKYLLSAVVCVQINMAHHVKMQLLTLSNNIIFCRLVVPVLSSCHSLAIKCANDIIDNLYLKADTH